eukprot:CAMPEP_0198428928 /NCGR_PEP_ID=MMETSP1452-20131203/6868_1 /TAXON_ID=1181717 /ORGANISM="Synchroma pusillum, Strain CCMP3072" /LENGTH=182 /DNA_ID=CAMNT_0044149329 /DNA_START=36 /DNA_END=581 /DNA_ORIENTATION=+
MGNEQSTWASGPRPQLLPEDVLARIAAVKAGETTELDLSRCLFDLNTEAMEALATELRGVPQVTMLDLRRNSMRPAGADALARVLVGAEHLRTLHTEGNEWGFRGNRAMVIAACSHTTTLRELSGIALDRHLGVLGLDPEEFRGADNDRILEVIRDRNIRGAVPTARALVVLVGPGSAGKSA